MAKRESFSDSLRRHVRQCGESRYRISAETGIAQSTLSEFVRGARGLSLESLDALAKYLDLNVIRESKGK